MKYLLVHFFQNKARAYWTLQAAGWIAYALLRFLNGLANKMSLTVIVPTLVGMLTGLALSLLLTPLYRSLIGSRRPVVTWVLTLVAVISSAIIFSVIDVWAYALWYDNSWSPQGLEFLGSILVDLYVIATWTALYYGINYYLLLRVQGERLLYLATQAQVAQLKMLRYQLNPHFLFNTLNSLSTLILEGETVKGNAMLTRLASFLRYSLISEPTQKVTVSKEIEANAHYLDIERMRFEDMLEIEYDISEASKKALVPSLLLQPLIENAIKHAVAVQEEGAKITIRSGIQQGRLNLVVEDTGPGLRSDGQGEEGDPSDHRASTHVGLANIADRLNQTYGKNHSFVVEMNSPKGLKIKISIPLEYSGRENNDQNDFSGRRTLGDQGTETTP